MKLLPGNGDQHVRGHGAPDLRLDRVLARAQEVLDAQVLLDPFEEQLHLPAALVKRANGQGRQCRVVGQEDQRLAGGGILVADAPQVLGVIPHGIMPGQHDPLVADQAGGTIDLGRVHTPAAHAHLGAGHEEGSSLMHDVESGEIDITAIHHVDRARFDRQPIQDLHVGHLAIADVDECRNGAAQIQQRVQLHGRLRRAERCPVEKAQAKIDGGGVECIDGVVQFDAEWLGRVQHAGASNQHRSQVGPDTPVPLLVGVGQRRSFDLRPKPHRVKLGGVRRQAGFDVAQALAPGQLRERHCPELLGAGQAAHASIPGVPLHDPRKAGPRYELHQLGKQRLAFVHSQSSGKSPRGGYAEIGKRSSNRHQAKSAGVPCAARHQGSTIMF